MTRGTGCPAATSTAPSTRWWRPRRGERLLVLDYKYALPRPGSADRYRVQLAAYALAASRASGGAPVEARLQFLRGDFSSLDVTPAPEDLVALARAAPVQARDLSSGGGDRTPAELGRDEARCLDGRVWLRRALPPAGPRPAAVGRGGA